MEQFRQTHFDWSFRSVSSTTLILLVALCALTLLYKLSTRTDIGTIHNLPSIPGSVPFFGHLFQLGDDHATVCEQWWRQYNYPTFQVKLGNTRAVIVNSFEDVKRMLIGHQSAVIDRPTLYTFHGVISSTQGFTIGSSPWDTSCKNRRAAAGRALGRGRLKAYTEMFDLESYCIVRDLTKACIDTTGDELNTSGDSDIREIDVRPFFQRYALNTTLTLCYGIRMDDVYDGLLREILEVGSAISLLRSASENFQDYVPIFRYWPTNTKNERSEELRERRDRYLEFLLNKVRGMIERGVERECIASAIIKDEESKLSNVEVSSICLSLVSGGFETIPGTLTSCVGSLATDEGIEWQDQAYQDIMKYHGGDTGSLEQVWEASFLEEKAPWVNAIVKEAARYYTVSAMSLPRKTVSEIKWKTQNGQEAIIPPKTMILINAQAANHDVDHFGINANKFDPTRWLHLDTTSSNKPAYELSPSVGPPHFSFGAGSRACSGQIIANRLLYTALVRLISCYRILPSSDVNARANTDYVDYNAVKSALVAIPRDFRVRLVKREGMDLEGVLEKWRVRVEGSYADM